MRDHSSAVEAFHRRMDAIYQALPPLDSEEYLRHLRDASKEELPAHVLVRAFRETAKHGSVLEEAGNRTFARLISKNEGRFEYLGPAVEYLATRLPRNQYAQDLEDLLQDTAAKMLDVLATKRGSYGERAWYSFARQCAVEVWREHVGRKGEREEPPREEPQRDAATGEWFDPLERIREGQSGGTGVEVDAYDLLREVIKDIADPFLRAVAEDQWLSGDPSPASGDGCSAGGKPSLEAQLRVSRDRIVRAQRAVEARILAALEARGVPEEALAPYAKKPR